MSYRTAMPASVGNLSPSPSLSLSLFSRYSALTQTFQSGLFFPKAPWKLGNCLKFGLKLLLEKIQLNFLSWLEIIYLALEYNFWTVDPSQAGPESRAFFLFFQARLQWRIYIVLPN